MSTTATRSALFFFCVALSACFASGGAPPTTGMEAPGAAPPQGEEGSATQGRWELVRPGEPTLVLDVRGDVVVLERETAAGRTSEALAKESEDRYVAPPDLDRAVTAEVASTSCVEVVAVEPDALVVRIGVMTDGVCVLSDETLRFARQTQR